MSLRRFACFVLLLALAGGADAGARRDGDLDGKFGFFGSSFQFFPNDVPIGYSYIEPAVQPDGKLLVGGTKSASPTTDYGVLRLMPDGSVDSGFGVDGAATAAFDKSGILSYDLVTGLALQGDGKIVVAGYVGTSSGTDFGIARFTVNGLPDNNFGIGGKATVAFNLGNCAADTSNCQDIAQRVGLQNDGKILVAGWANTAAQASVMALARLTTTGQPDPTFDSDGRVTVAFNGGMVQGYRARQLSDGQHIVVVGSAIAVAGGFNIDFALAKFDASGQPDATFGIGGKTTFGFDAGGGNADTAFDFAELADGKLLVCGTAQITLGQNYDFACMRFTADGKPDNTFAPLVIPFDIGGALTDIAYSVRVDSQGRILLAGAVSRDQYNNDFGIVRLMPDGNRDYAFGTSGYVRIGSAPLLGTDSSNEASGIAIQADEKIVVAGSAFNSDGKKRFQVVRMYGDTIFSADQDGG